MVIVTDTCDFRVSQESFGCLVGDLASYGWAVNSYVAGTEARPFRALLSLLPWEGSPSLCFLQWITPSILSCPGFQVQDENWSFLALLWPPARGLGLEAGSGSRREGGRICVGCSEQMALAHPAAR